MNIHYVTRYVTLHVKRRLVWVKSGAGEEGGGWPLS